MNIAEIVDFNDEDEVIEYDDNNYDNMCKTHRSSWSLWQLGSQSQEKANILKCSATENDSQGAPLPLGEGKSSHCLSHGRPPTEAAGGHHLSQRQQGLATPSQKTEQAAKQGAQKQATENGNGLPFGPQPFCSRSNNKLEPKFSWNGKVFIFSDKTAPATDKKATSGSELLSEEQALRKCMLYRCV